MFTDDFGRIVRETRLRKGLTQQALAAAAGLSRATIAQVEAGTVSDLGVRKVERMLAILGLGLRIGGAMPGESAKLRARPGSRAPARTRLERLFAARSADRKARAAALAGKAMSRLASQGVSARLVGSMARGGFRPDSDVDFLIENRGGQSEPRIIDMIERELRGFPFDVIFAERADPRMLETIRREAGHGASPVRAN